MWSRATDGAGGHSLRRRLLGLVLASVAVASVLQGATAYRAALRTADALFDGQLQAMARSAQAGRPMDTGDPTLSIQIWSRDGVLLFNAGVLRLERPPAIGFSDVTVDGTRLRVYTVQTSERTVQITQDLDARQARARALALEALLPVTLLGLLLMVAVWLVIDRSLAPVERVRRELAGRRAEDLVPVSQAGLPREVGPLVRELNQLFRRVGEAFRSQQRFVADAAHELRSPLAALRLQVQALRRHEPGPEQERAVQGLEAAVDRAVMLVNQLLTLAREEAAEPAAREPVDLLALVREVTGEVLPLAHARRVDVGMREVDTAPAVQTAAEPLRALLRNLLENAVKYTPPGGRVDIGISRLDGRQVLDVEDSGPGIPPGERDRVFERFHRGAAPADVPGSGLGLAIVAAVAQRLGLSVELDSSPTLGGLRVRVRFPAQGTP